MVLSLTRTRQSRLWPDLLDEYDEDEFEVKDYTTYVSIDVYGNLYEINLYEEYLQE